MSLSRKFSNTPPRPVFVLALIFPLALTACSASSEGPEPGSEASPVAAESAAPAHSTSPEPADDADLEEDSGPDVVDFDEESADGDDAAPAVDLDGVATSTGGTADFVMAGESFSFTVESCVITDEEIVIHGPGEGNETGDPAYLDIMLGRDGSFRTGEARVDVGSDEQKPDWDAFYVLDIAAGHEYGLMTLDHSLELEGNFYYAGENDVGPGTITVECG